MPLDDAGTVKAVALASLGQGECFNIDESLYKVLSGVTHKGQANVVEGVHQRAMIVTSFPTFFEIRLFVLRNVSVSLRTIRRRLADRDLNAFRPVRALELSACHRRARL